MHKYEDRMYRDEDITIPLTRGKLEECIRYNEFTKEPIVEIWKDNAPYKILT